MPENSIDYGKEAAWFDQMVEHVMKTPGYSDNIQLISEAGTLDDIRIEASATQNAIFGMDSAGIPHGTIYEKEADWLEKAGNAAMDVGMYLRDKICLEKARELYATAMRDYEMAGKLSNRERVYFKLISIESELAKNNGI